MSSEEILDKARKFYNDAKASGRQINWNDYEYFKKMLHNEGIFGEEFRLANILHI